MALGARLHWPDIVTPAGIRQAYQTHRKPPPYMSWSAKAIRGLTYIVTDRGPQRQWLKEIGKAEEAWCVCDGWTPQNAVHLGRCPRVGDGKGRSPEQMWRDEEWCEVRRSSGFPEVKGGVIYVDSLGRAGTGPCGGERPPALGWELQSIAIVTI